MEVKTLLTVIETVELLKISKFTVKKGKLSAIRVGKLLRFDYDQLAFQFHLK